MEHAEKALVAAAPMFGAIRFARSRLFQIEEGEGALAIRRLTLERLNHAWNAWERFQEPYVLVRLYSDRKSNKWMSPLKSGPASTS